MKKPATPKRTKPRRGRYMREVDVLPIIDGDDHLKQLDDWCSGKGYERRPRSRPYLQANGVQTVRIVWRKRSAQKTVTCTYVFRSPASAVAAT